MDKWIELVDQNEWSEILENLVVGRDHITYDELLTLFPEAEENTELLETLLDELASLDVAVIEEPADKPNSATTAHQTADLQNVSLDSLLNVYLAEMSQEQLLTFDQEVNLGWQIVRGQQAQQALTETDYTAEEYKRLQAQVEAGQAAREHLGRANTRLVVSIAKRYRGFGIPFSDLIQDGNVGLMRAVDRYDPSSGNRFSTYATWWIRQAVTRSLANHGRIIRIPVHMGGRMREMTQVAQRLEIEHGQRPTPEEIAAEMGETPTKIRQMMRWSNQTLSLEQPIGEDGDAKLGDFIEDEKIGQPEELTDDNLLNETLEGLLNNLTLHEERVLRLRYGLQDGQSRTLHQIAEKFGLSRERIRQIERQALLKLSLVAGKHGLEQFLGV